MASRAPVTSRELDRTFVGFSTGVREEDLAATPEETVEFGGEFGARQRPVEIGDVQEGAGGLADRFGDGRMGVTERRDGESTDEVEVLIALGVVEPAASAADKSRRRRSVGWHEGSDVGHEGSSVRVSMVPTPVAVRSSSRRTWGMRPSRMCAEDAPASTASRHAVTLGIMPPTITPSPMRTRA